MFPFGVGLLSHGPRVAVSPWLRIPLPAWLRVASRLSFELFPGLLDSREHILYSLVLLFMYGTITVEYAWQDCVSLTL